MADTRKRRPAEGGAPSLKEDRPEDSTTSTFVTSPFVTFTGGLSITTLLAAECHVRRALRLLQLDPDLDREAKVLDLAAARIRARRWAA
jgi:hypothetical protein